MPGGHLDYRKKRVYSASDLLSSGNSDYRLGRDEATTPGRAAAIPAPAIKNLGAFYFTFLDEIFDFFRGFCG